MKNKQKEKKPVLGQNFLVNKEIAGGIVDSCNFSAKDAVVEIGPGRGILTDLIAKKAGDLTVLEIDPFYFNLIKGKYTGKENLNGNNIKLEIFNVDALKFDYRELSGLKGTKLRVISNLPYEISSPIIDRFINDKDVFSDLTLMFQKEFANRLCAAAGDAGRGALSVIAEINFNIERLFDVGRENFNPVPEVDSTVLRLVPRVLYDVDGCLEWAAGSGSKFFNYFVHQIFKLRRKKLRNSIYASFFGIPPDVKEKIFTEENGIDLNKRPQELTTAELVMTGKKYDEYLEKQGL